MSEPAITLPCMYRINEDELYDWFRVERVEVVEESLPAGVWGLYDLDRRIVWVQRGLPASFRLATLLHEAVHHSRGDHGHQDTAVENRINEVVADLLVDPVEYALAERELGWSTGGIAVELGLPRWVVSAFRRSLAKGLAKPRV